MATAEPRRFRVTCDAPASGAYGAASPCTFNGYRTGTAETVAAKPCPRCGGPVQVMDLEPANHPTTGGTMSTHPTPADTAALERETVDLVLTGGGTVTIDLTASIDQGLIDTDRETDTVGDVIHALQLNVEQNLVMATPDGGQALVTGTVEAYVYHRLRPVPRRSAGGAA